MLEAVVRPQRAQERLLERVLGRRPAEPPGEEAEDRVAMLGVEASRTAGSSPRPPSSWSNAAGRENVRCASGRRRTRRVDRLHPRRVGAEAGRDRPRIGDVGRRRRGAARSRRCSSRTSVARPRFFTALGDDELGHRSQRRARREGRACSTSPGLPRAAAPRRHVRRRRGRADDHRDRREAPSARRGRVAPVGGAAPQRLRLLHRPATSTRCAKARHARVLVATARELPTLSRAGVELDALVGSATDEGERYEAGDARSAAAGSSSRRPGRLGGWAQPGGPFAAAPPARADRGRVRRRRLLRRRAHLRARPRRRAARSARARGALRRDGRDRPRPVRAPADGRRRLDAGLGRVVLVAASGLAALGPVGGAEPPVASHRSAGARRV